MKLYELDELIKTVCPIDGINSNGVIFFREIANAEERAAAEALMAAHLPQLEA
jgi:hypothetical protein